MRADSGFYAHALQRGLPRDGCPLLRHHPAHARLRNLIEAIPETDLTPVPYRKDGAAVVAETTYTPFQSEPYAALVRLIVPSVKPTPGSQPALIAAYNCHGFITYRDGATLVWLGTGISLSSYLKPRWLFTHNHSLGPHRVACRSSEGWERDVSSMPAAIHLGPGLCRCCHLHPLPKELTSQLRETSLFCCDKCRYSQVAGGSPVPGTPKPGGSNFERQRKFRPQRGRQSGMPACPASS